MDRHQFRRTSGRRREVFEGSDESINVLIVDVCVNNKALGGDTRLATVQRPCLHPSFEGRIEVCVVKDDERVRRTGWGTDCLRR